MLDLVNDAIVLYLCINLAKTVNMFTRNGSFIWIVFFRIDERFLTT